MKKLFLLLFTFILVLPSLYSQEMSTVYEVKGIYYHRFEITPMVGYQFGGKINFIQGDFKMYDNVNYGGALDLLLGRSAPHRS